MKALKNYGNKVFAIDKYRVLNGLTQKELADKAGVERTKCSMVETLTFDELDAIAKVLGISKGNLVCSNSQLKIDG